MAETQAITLRLPTGTQRLPDERNWTNRFHVRSESSSRLYVIAQEKNKRYWGCSCPAWRTRRYCKHLSALGLPCHEVPKEVKLVNSAGQAV